MIFLKILYIIFKQVKYFQSFNELFIIVDMNLWY